MENEKNRPAEKPFDKSAGEDFYFAARDRELVAEMKAYFQTSEAAARGERASVCPKCSGKLLSYGFMEFVVERCHDCEGLWLGKGRLEGILRRAARGPLGAFFDRCFSKDETGRQI
jgi:Zn-finger nucleic acid-binding protein